MFGKRSTPAKDLTSELEQVPGHWVVAAHCRWVVKMGQMHKTKSSKESNKEEVHQWSYSSCFTKLRPSSMCLMEARHVKVNRGPGCVWTPLTLHRNIHCTQTATRQPGKRSCQWQCTLYALWTGLRLENSLYEEATSSLTDVMEKTSDLSHGNSWYYMSPNAVRAFIQRVTIRTKIDFFCCLFYDKRMLWKVLVTAMKLKP